MKEIEDIWNPILTKILWAIGASVRIQGSIKGGTGYSRGNFNLVSSSTT